MSKNNKLNSDYLTYDQLSRVRGIYSKERRIISIGLLLVILITIQDFLEDLLQEGQPWIYILTDLIYMGIMFGLLIYIWRFAPLALKQRNLILTQEVIKQHRDAEKWRQQSFDLMRGLSSMIEQQLNDWHLSIAQKQVALLILKGLSLKEIAAVRETGEPTVRQQATQIYTKAGVSGRAQLSAFFLEDLLLPVE